MDDRTLEALGLAVAPRDDPLAYPGVRPEESGLLHGDRLLPLGHGTYEDRTPVLAIGSNASPGQLRHKMAEFGITSPIPMVRTKVTGIDVGVSAHVSLMGYVSASPFHSPGTVRELFLTWLDADQLACIDASEGVPVATGAYDRAWLPASDFRIEVESGEVLPGAHLYVNRRGILHDGSGTPRRHLDQHPLLTALLAGSPRLRELFGSTSEEFSARARFDRELCAAGTRLFAAEWLTMPSGLEGYVTERYVSDQQTGSPGIGESLSPPLM